MNQTTKIVFCILLGLVALGLLIIILGNVFSRKTLDENKPNGVFNKGRVVSNAAYLKTSAPQKTERPLHERTTVVPPPSVGLSLRPGQTSPYPIEDNYSLKPTGSLTALTSVAVSGTGVVFAIDLPNDLLVSLDNGVTFKMVPLRPHDSAVTQFVDIAYDPSTDSLSLLVNSSKDNDTVILQSVETFAVELILEAVRNGNTIQARIRSVAEQPNGGVSISRNLPACPTVAPGVQLDNPSSSRYSSIAYDGNGKLFGLYQNPVLRQTDVYLFDRVTGSSTFQGPLDSAVVKMIFDPRKNSKNYLTSYGITNPLFATDNALAVINNSSSEVQPVSIASAEYTSIKGSFQSIGGSPTLLYVVKGNRLYYYIPPPVPSSSVTIPSQ
jgi:hypothetical protein